MTRATQADPVLLTHMRDCLGRICEYTGGDRLRFATSRLVQDAVLLNLQTLAESSQRPSPEIKATEPDIPWRELGGFRNVIVHDYLSVDVAAVWLVIEQDLPGLTKAVDRMIARFKSKSVFPGS